MLAVEFGAVLETALVGLAQKRIEWLVLTCAQVNARQPKCHRPLHSLNRVSCFGSQAEEVWRLGPKIDNSLDGGPGFKNFDGQANVRDGKSFHDVDG
jgi:hypothetical protein